MVINRVNCRATTVLSCMFLCVSSEELCYWARSLSIYGPHCLSLNFVVVSTPSERRSVCQCQDIQTLYTYQDSSIKDLPSHLYSILTILTFTTTFFLLLILYFKLKAM